jgi:hypothetical protein
MNHPSSSIDRLLQIATESHRSGDLVAARRSYAEALTADPANTLA